MDDYASSIRQLEASIIAEQQKKETLEVLSDNHTFFGISAYLSCSGFLGRVQNQEENLRSSS